MFRYLFIFLFSACSFSLYALPSVFQYGLITAGNDSIPLKNFAGKKILIVNIATSCGFTPQLAGLEKLSKKYKDHLVVIGVPSNDFLQTREKNDEGVLSFCQKNYGVTFLIAKRAHVKKATPIPLFQFLTKKQLNGVGDFEIGWNFNKFLLNEKGELLAHFPSKTKPEDQALVQWLN